MARLHKPIGWSLAVALCAAAAPAAAPAQSARTSSPARVFEVNTGRGRLVTLTRPMSDLFVADDTVADVQVRSPTQLYIFGKKAGETTVSATTKGGAVVYAATVRVGNNYDSIGNMLHLAMPDAQITATPMNGLVLLTGTVGAPADAAEAERLVQAYVGDTIKVLSRLKTATPLQVNLQVRFAEVSKTFAKNIGVNLASVDGSSGFKFGVGQGGLSAPQYTPGGPLGVGLTTGPTGSTLVKNGSQRTTLGLAGHLLGLDLLSSIDLGETTGQVTTLANPNLTALSGETGTFLAGGEIPIPVSQGLGAVSVEYKQYGVSLSYTPTVLSDGRISLRVRPEVSQLSSDGAVTLSGTTIPALTTRRAETTVELGSGQSFMIGGLLQNTHNNVFDKTPGVGDVPILGALFRSNAWKRNETELVIIITPYLVKPVDSLSQIALPTDGYRTATDLSRILGGNLSGGTGAGGTRPVPTIEAPESAAPTLGVVAPAGMPVRREEPVADTSRPAKGNKGTAPAPGFSIQ